MNVTLKSIDTNPFNLLFLFLGMILATSPGFAFAENIDPDNNGSQFAWGENIGWVNAEPGGDGGTGVLVEDDSLTGYMWGENVGWISLSCLNSSTCGVGDFRVTNDSAGNLGGYAWGENIGWISFSCTNTNSCATGNYGVTIDPTTGEFSGRAWGENIGWITFRSTGPNPFGVTTSWLNVVADAPPVISLVGNDPAFVSVGVNYEDVGATAFDNLDGDITINIVVGGLPIDTSVPGTHTVTYDVNDAQGNPAAQVTRTVNIIPPPPPTLEISTSELPSTSSNSLGRLGHSVSAAGDFNDDGVPDMIVGGPGTNSNAGSAHLLLGPLGTESGVLTGSAGELLGTSVAYAGDFNNDGIDDVIMGAPARDWPIQSVGPGKAYIVYGGQADFDADVILEGDVANSEFGFSVFSAGDFNNDGIDDVVVGAPGDNTVYIFFGRDTGSTPVTLLASQADWTIVPNSLVMNSGPTAWVASEARFGHVVRSGDFVTREPGSTADGIRDVIIGVPGSVLGDVTAPGGAFVGRVAVVYGGQADADFDGVYLGDIFNAGDENRCAASVAFWDPDGSQDDVPVFGCPGMFSGFGLPGGFMEKAEGGGGLPLRAGTESGENFGFAMANAGDFNGDGVPDLMVGSPFISSPGTGKTTVILNGADPAEDFVIEGTEAGSQFGYAVSPAGDLNQDGLMDVIVGAPGSNASTGKVFVFFGKDANADSSLTIDATALTAPEFQIAGVGTFDASAPHGLDLDPGTYTLSSALTIVVTGTAGSIDFTVAADGTLEFDSSLDGVLSGRGTTALVVHGVGVQIDARALVAQKISFAGTGSGFDTTQVIPLQLVPGGQVFSITNLGGTVVSFTVAPDGTLGYDSALTDFLSGEGTNTLVIDGYLIQVNAITLGVPTFTMRSIVVDADATVEHTFHMTPGQYEFQADSGSGMNFQVTDEGTIDFDSSLDGFLSGRDTALLTVNGDPSGSNVLTVNVSDDLTDGTCDATHCSLREAILASEASAGVKDVIAFDIPNTVPPTPHTIQPDSPLPFINDPVTIDGYTQPGATANTLATGSNAVLMIELDGTNAGPSSFGLLINASNSTFRGLVINRFARTGLITRTPTVGNHFEGNYIGTDVMGTQDFGNLEGGMRVEGGNHTVGGSTPAARNVISGNDYIGITLQHPSSTGNHIVGNYIGTNAAGDAAAGNNISGIHLAAAAHHNTIGGTTPGSRNVISGNITANGIMLGGSVGTLAHHNVIEGNYIGTDATGLDALPNGNGLWITSTDNTVGGSTAAARNVISGNHSHGMVFSWGVGIPSAFDNLIQGNYIGTDVSGDAPLGNGAYGIFVTNEASRNTFDGNVISANSFGIVLGLGDENTVTGNLIGLNAAGTSPIGNANQGMSIASPNHIIGGTTPEARNVISGNGGSGISFFGVNTIGNVVQGNYIGTNAAGLVPMANGEHGVIVAHANNNTIGGTTGTTPGGSCTGACNLISGNTAQGIHITTAGGTADNNTVLGNFIGTNVTGTDAIANSGTGVSIVGGKNNTIGGTTVNERNVISGNALNGMEITGPSATGNVVQGNYIGTKAAGDAALGNGTAGVVLSSNASDNTIGGTVTGAGNVISGQKALSTTPGVLFSGTGTTDNTVAGNFIGTDAAGTDPIPNSRGVTFANGGTGNTIGGNVTGAGNVISGNTSIAVLLTGAGASGNTVQGNLIGTNLAGTAALGNAAGVFLENGASDNIIGGLTDETRNVISGNKNGVVIGNNTTGNQIQGNFIGTDISGTGDLGNEVNGIHVDGGASDNTIGPINTIRFNAEDGIMLISPGTSGNRIVRNIISDNGQLGIDLNNDGVTPNDLGDGDAGPNGLQNFPSNLAAIIPTGTTDATIGGTLDSGLNTSYTLEFFANAACDTSGFGEGKRFLGSRVVTTDGSGNATIEETLNVPVSLGEFVTATATDPDNNTSEFSACVEVTDGTVSWAQPVDGNWSDPTKWSTGRVPASIEDVTIAVGGTVTLDQDASVRDLSVSGAVLSVGGYSLTVDGTLFTESQSAGGVIASGLVMTNAADVVTVNGFATFSGLGLEGSRHHFTAGQLHLRGPFRALNTQSPGASPEGFVATGTTVVFDGTASQGVRFDSPRVDQSRFADVEISNPAGVRFVTDVVVTGQLTMVGNGAVSQSEPFNTVYTTHLPVTNNGYAIADNVVGGQITMTQDAALPNGSSLRIPGEVETLTVGGHNLTVDGALFTESRSAGGVIESGLVMTDPADVVTVNGFATFSGLGLEGSRHHFTAGQLHLRGPFRALNTQSPGASPEGFVATGTTVVFDGTASQGVRFDSPRVDQSRFADVEISNPAGVRFVSDVVATGSATNSGDMQIINGTTFMVDGSYTQTASGNLGIELGPLTGGNQNTRLVIGGTANLAGALNVNLVTGFLSSVLDRYDVLTYAGSTGNFATISGLTFGEAQGFSPLQQATTFSLTADLVTDIPFGGTTEGRFLAVGDQDLVVRELDNPRGVRLVALATGGVTPAVFEGCNGQGTLTLTTGDRVRVTCGSIEVEVITGPVEMDVEITGEPALVTVTDGNEVTYEEETGTFDTPPENTEPVVIELTVEGELAVVSLDGGNEVTIDADEGTFTAPPDNPDPVMVVVGGDEVTVEPGEAAKTVDIDIKPGNATNPINLGSNGVTKVAILSSANFDATTVDPLTIDLVGASVRLKGNGTPQATIKDVDGDGRDDLEVHVETSELQLLPTSTSAQLQATTTGGQLIKGSDMITVVPE